MFDTNLVVVGNVLAAPEWRRFESSGSVVANFRIASTARRFDRESNSWVDGNSLRVRVTAWRKLAEGVISSISVGDPVIVYGRLYTRDWKDDDGNPRITYEMEAYSIGHDLARGQGSFTRNRNTAGPGASTPEESAEELFAVDEAPAFAEVSDVAPDSAPDSDSESGPGDVPSDEEIALEVERLTAEQPAPARRARRTRKESVSA
ncbi:single-stranded DNA-binding protein [Paractinoplanes lichenicola]|uniref:Single-stranded DNA-binding protein n=1 Tax=Paractinoplanes lichenicola TaxID=2802976 RepID=A0ABS1W0W4_9ACTN|nr:single-stranded DNA-binding protein [Actinoplanes lichenicola]MBL7260376.1 single-stranded DNA-binding protein [Actinoplanes lichenicola]